MIYNTEQNYTVIPEINQIEQEGGFTFLENFL